MLADPETPAWKPVASQLCVCLSLTSTSVFSNSVVTSLTVYSQWAKSLGDFMYPSM